jgi:hypothetical protein
MAEVRGNNKHSGWLKLYRFLQWSRAYYVHADNPQVIEPEGGIYENRLNTQAFLRRFMHKLVHCQSPAEVKVYFDHLP